MTATFTTVEALNADFFGLISWFAMALCLAGMLVAYKDQSTRFPLDYKTWGIIFFALFAIIFFANYLSTYSRFVSVEVTDDQLHMRFSGLQASTTVLPLSAIETILVGTEGKNKRVSIGCYIRVVRKSGESDRSATLRERVEVCGEIRLKILTS